MYVCETRIHIYDTCLPAVDVVSPNNGGGEDDGDVDDAMIISARTPGRRDSLGQYNDRHRSFVPV